MWCYDPTGKRAAADRGSLSPDRWLIWVQIINSLLLYLLNGYFLVVSRTFLVQVLACTNPFVIVIGNMVFDLAGTFLLAKYVLMRPKVLRVLCGEAYLLREENL